MDNGPRPRRGRDYAAWLDEVITGAGPGPVDLVAASWGAWVALTMTMRMALRTASIVRQARTDPEVMTQWVLGDNPAVRDQPEAWMRLAQHHRSRLPFAAPLPAAHVSVIPDAGHQMIAENPAQPAQRITTFLAN